MTVILTGDIDSPPTKQEEENIKRYLRVCKKYGVGPTLFITTRNFIYPSKPKTKGFENLIRLIKKINPKTEIAFHNSYHYWEKNLNRILTEKFEEFFKQGLEDFNRKNIKVLGFREPALKWCCQTFDISKKHGLLYDSTVLEPLGLFANKPFTYKGLLELPITAYPDTDGFGREKQTNKDYANYLIQKARTSDYNCFLLHPWLTGQKEHIAALEMLLNNVKRVTNCKDFIRKNRKKFPKYGRIRMKALRYMRVWKITCFLENFVPRVKK